MSRFWPVDNFLENWDMETIKRWVAWIGGGTFWTVAVVALANVGFVLPAVLVGLFAVTVGVAYALDD
jgi:hypothetical protein